MNTPRHANARLLADIGGTNARFAWQDGPDEPITEVITSPSSAHPSLQAAMQHYLDRIGRPAPPLCAIGIATPVTGDRVQMTNHSWGFSIADLQQHFGFERLRVVNDFTALALALPALPPQDLLQVGGGAAVADAPRALIGPGTGLGVSGLLRDQDGRWVPIQGEGGHVSLGPATAREAAVVLALQARFGHASAERAVSGNGLVWLYEALCGIDGVACPQPPEPAWITAQALAGSDARCAETLALFFALLGSVAGNLALTLGALGGVYVGGGILPRMVDAFQASDFRARFEAKGRYRDYLAAIPVYLIVAQEPPALLGASRAL